VWRAFDTSLERDVAVKLLPVDSLGDLAAVERFRREARTTAGLQHPNIVSILDAGDHDGSAFIVMELLDGPTLAQLLADRGPLPEPEVVGLAAQITAGLSAAHRAGVIHRDLKPSNLMFGSTGGLKILDFGIARLAEATTSHLTATNAILGSPAYLSPEQATGSPADARSDLYSLGCILTAMVTGSPPFTGEHPVAILHQHVHEDPPLLQHRQPAVSPALEALVQHLLQKSPDDRPQSAEAVEQQLAAIANGRPAALTTTVLASTQARLATTPLVDGRHTAPAPTLVQAPVAAMQPSPASPDAPARRGRPTAIAVAAIAVVAALTGALLATGHEPADTPTASRTAPPTPSRPSSTNPTPSAAATTGGLSTTSPSPKTEPTRPKPKEGKSHPPKKHHGPKRPKG